MYHMFFTAIPEGTHGSISPVSRNVLESVHLPYTPSLAPRMPHILYALLVVGAAGLVSQQLAVELSTGAAMFLVCGVAWVCFSKLVTGGER